MNALEISDPKQANKLLTKELDKNAKKINKDPFGQLIAKALWANVHSAQGESSLAEKEMNEVLDQLEKDHKNTPANKQSELIEFIKNYKILLNYYII